MKEEIAQAVKQGMPCMAECGGFMYLHEEMEAMDKNFTTWQACFRAGHIVHHV